MDVPQIHAPDFWLLRKGKMRGYMGVRGQFDAGDEDLDIQTEECGQFTGKSLDGAESHCRKPKGHGGSCNPLHGMTFLAPTSVFPSGAAKRGEQMTCRKCGSADIHTSFHEDEYACRNILHSQYRFNGEHLHRYCRGCQYQWFTSCEDAAQAEPKGENAK